jgi:PBP1b-binding outer membrane lipoprotein LpoB
MKMKKLLSTTLTLALLLSMGTVAKADAANTAAPKGKAVAETKAKPDVKVTPAAKPETKVVPAAKADKEVPPGKLPKTVDTTLTADRMTVAVGETVTLTAATLKHGSGYTVEWKVNQEEYAVNSQSTSLNKEGSYVSTAKFEADKAGTYTISYGIVMNAGKSGVTFVGEDSITIKVVDETSRSVARFEISKWDVLKQSQGRYNDKQALIITELHVYYEGETESYEKVYYKIGNIEANTDKRTFEIVYGGRTEIFNLKEYIVKL